MTRLVHPFASAAPAPWMRSVRHQDMQVTAFYWRTLRQLGLVGEADQAELLDERARADQVRYARNIENYVGTVRVPVGVIGPLRINGAFAKGAYYLPLATTEAALVASYGRGARLISSAGGCEAAMVAHAVQRAPAFAFRSIADAIGFATWTTANANKLKAVADSTTSHGRLSTIAPLIEGDHVYLVCSYTTGEAAGQNMVTFATNALCQTILSDCPIKPKYWFLEANLSGDKKASALSLQSVRGRKATAAVELDDEAIRRFLHTSAERMAEFWRITSLGGAMSGTIGVQGHYANGLAALYLATGQDIACVAESAIGITRMELRAGNRLYVAVTLPNIMVGAVGGGTQLPSQAAALNILGLSGLGRANALAEVCAAVSLAGELSISGALCAGEFATAHRRLARGGAR